MQNGAAFTCWINRHGSKAGGQCCSKQIAIRLVSPGGGEEQLVSVREKADDAPGFDGHPHRTPHPKQLAHLSRPCRYKDTGGRCSDTGLPVQWWQFWTNSLLQGQNDFCLENYRVEQLVEEVESKVQWVILQCWHVYGTGYASLVPLCRVRLISFSLSYLPEVWVAHGVQLLQIGRCLWASAPKGGPAGDRADADVTLPCAP